MIARRYGGDEIPASLHEPISLFAWRELLNRRLRTDNQLKVGNDIDDSLAVLAESLPDVHLQFFEHDGIGLRQNVIHELTEGCDEGRVWNVLLKLLVLASYYQARVGTAEPSPSGFREYRLSDPRRSGYQEVITAPGL